MKTRKQKFAEWHNRIARLCLEIAKENLKDGYNKTCDYFLELAKTHQEMVHSYGY